MCWWEHGGWDELGWDGRRGEEREGERSCGLVGLVSKTVLSY